jgi:P27 family predicted phage terminase small subunit
MSRRGPRPTPKSILTLRGSWRAKTGGEEPPAPKELPQCPDHLADVAKAEWQRLTPLLTAMGCLSTVDQSTLAAYCQAYARWVKAEGMLKLSGEVLSGANGLYQNPYLAVANKALEQMTRLAQEFGLSPAARARLKTDTAPPQNHGQTKSRFFNRTG